MLVIDMQRPVWMLLGLWSASGKGDGELVAWWKSIAYNERAISYYGFLQREWHQSNAWTLSFKTYSFVMNNAFILPAGVFCASCARLLYVLPLFNSPRNSGMLEPFSRERQACKTEEIVQLYPTQRPIVLTSCCLRLRTPILNGHVASPLADLTWSYHLKHCFHRHISSIIQWHEPQRAFCCQYQPGFFGDWGR